MFLEEAGTRSSLGERAREAYAVVGSRRFGRAGFLSAGAAGLNLGLEAGAEVARREPSVLGAEEVLGSGELLAVLGLELGVGEPATNVQRRFVFRSRDSYLGSRVSSLRMW